jgi:hypothetical protein
MTVYGLILLGDCPSLGKDFDIRMAFMPAIGFSFFAVYIAGTVPKPGNPLNGYESERGGDRSMNCQVAVF